jgi:hypothetical protein
LWPTLIARTTLKTVTTNHGGSEFAGTTEGGVAEGVATGESVSESHAGPNRTAVAMRCNWTLRTRSELRPIRLEPEAATGCEGAQIATRAVARPNVDGDADPLGPAAQSVLPPTELMAGLGCGTVSRVRCCA